MTTINGFQAISDELLTDLQRIQKAEVPAAVEHFADDVKPICGELANLYEIVFNRFQRAASIHILPIKKQVDNSVDDSNGTFGHRLYKELEVGHDEIKQTLVEELVAKKRAAPIEHDPFPELNSDSPTVNNNKANLSLTIDNIHEGDLQTSPADNAIVPGFNRGEPGSPEYELRKAKTAMAGVDQANIAIPEESRQRSVIFFSLTVMLIVFEAFTSYSLWERQSTPLLAVSISIITVVLLTGLAKVGFSHLRIRHSHRDALRDFKKHYGDKHPDGFTVDDLPTTETKMTFWGLGIFTLISLAVLGMRIWLNMQGEGDPVNFAVVIGLLFICFAYGYFYEYRTSPPYRKEQYAVLRRAEGQSTAFVERNQSVLLSPTTLRRMEAEVVANEAKARDAQTKADELKALREAQEETEKARLDALKRDPEGHELHTYSQVPEVAYTQRMDLLEARIDHKHKMAQEHRSELAAMLVKVNDLWDETKLSYRRSCNDAIQRIAMEHNKKGNDLVGSDPMKFTDDVMRLLNDRVELKFSDASYLDRVTSYHFEFTRKSIRLTSFVPIYAEVAHLTKIQGLGGETLDIAARELGNEGKEL